MKLPKAAHTFQPWRIREIAPDFPLADVWALPTPGGPDDFPRLVRLIATGRHVDQPVLGRPHAPHRPLEARGSSVGTTPDSGVGSRVPTLRHRLPAGLAMRPPGRTSTPFRSARST